jgi:hypothetical protein
MRKIWSEPCTPPLQHQFIAPPVNRNACSSRSEWASYRNIFVGYSTDHMAYRLWDPSTRKVELARDVQFFENVFPAAGDHSDAQELSFAVISFPEEGSQQRGDSADGSAPSNPPESVSDDSEHLIQLPVAPEAPAAPPAPPMAPAARPAPSAPPQRPRASPAAPAAPPPVQHRLQRLFRADCCDSALMRYWSPEYCDWRVALLTKVGEEDCAVLPIFFSYFYAFY